MHLKINFIINDMEVYHAKFFLLNIHDATSLLDLEKRRRHKFITHI